MDDTPSDSPPGVVYHYTTASGLESILRNGVLWATDLLYLNDSAELEYVFSLLSNAADAGSFSTLPGVEMKGAQLLTDIIERLKRTYIDAARIYVACFCKCGNLLSQWRGYAGGTGGFSIGLQWNELQTARSLSRRGQQWDFEPIIYDLADQNAQVKDIVLPTLAAALRNWSPTATEEEALALTGALLTATLVQLGRIGPTFKSSAFAEEQEWRAIRRTDSGQPEPVKFRSAAVGLTPFIELDITDSSNLDRPLIEEIWVGPSPDQHLAKRAVGMLLQQLGFAEGEVPIRCSETSLR